MVSEAILEVEAKLRSKLEQALFDTLVAGAKAGTPVLKSALSRKLAALADDVSIKGWRFDKTNPKATEWARNHAAETVQGVSRRTREDIRDAVEAAFEQQFDVKELAGQITDMIGDSARAERIARTEVMRASNEGQQQLWGQAVDDGFLTGKEQKEWIVTPDDRLCPICEPLDGETVALDDSFDVDGDLIDTPPAHPNCRCTIGLSV